MTDPIEWSAEDADHIRTRSLRRDHAMTEVTAETLRAYREEAERTKNDPDPPGTPPPTRPNLARSKVLQVRLNPEEFDELQQYAENREVPASSLARGWILARLAGESQDEVLGAVDEIAEDVARLRRLVS